MGTRILESVVSLQSLCLPVFANRTTLSANFTEGLFISYCCFYTSYLSAIVRENLPMQNRSWCLNAVLYILFVMLHVKWKTRNLVMSFTCIILSHYYGQSQPSLIKLRHYWREAGSLKLQPLTSPSRPGVKVCRSRGCSVLKADLDLKTRGSFFSPILLHFISKKKALQAFVPILKAFY